MKLWLQNELADDVTKKPKCLYNNMLKEFRRNNMDNTLLPSLSQVQNAVNNVKRKIHGNINNVDVTRQKLNELLLDFEKWDDLADNTPFVVTDTDDEGNCEVGIGSDSGPFRFGRTEYKFEYLNYNSNYY